MMKQKIPIPGQEAFHINGGIGTVNAFDFDAEEPYIEIKFYRSMKPKRYPPKEICLLDSVWTDYDFSFVKAPEIT